MCWKLFGFIYQLYLLVIILLSAFSQWHKITIIWPLFFWSDKYGSLLFVTVTVVNKKSFSMLKQEKNCSHEVTVVLFSRTFYNAKTIGESFSFIISELEWTWLYLSWDTSSNQFPQMNFLRFWEDPSGRIMRDVFMKTSTGQLKWLYTLFNMDGRLLTVASSGSWLRMRDGMSGHHYWSQSRSSSFSILSWCGWKKQVS